MLANDRACTRVTLPNFHGNEGVSGSSPEEGFTKRPAKSSVALVKAANACLVRALAGHLAVRTLFARGVGFRRGKAE